MIYALYDEHGDRVGGCEIQAVEDAQIAVELVKRTNTMVALTTAGVESGVRPVIGKDHQRYEIIYSERGRVLAQFYAIPQVIGHA
jgi:hypothetical protein